MFRLWLIKLLPFMGKYIEVAGACCGGCPTCIGTAATGITLDVIASKPDDDD
jgi:Na+/H+ antiporter NhaD/arsenite permease-like protein